jgi:hypothetical protein
MKKPAESDAPGGLLNRFGARHSFRNHRQNLLAIAAKRDTPKSVQFPQTLAVAGAHSQHPVISPNFPLTDGAQRDA